MSQPPEISNRVLSPLKFLVRSELVYPHKTAVVHGDRRISYREFADRARRLAAGLLAAGLRPGDRVAFLCPNVPAMLDAHFGVPLARGVLVALNTRLAADEIRYILEHSGSRFLFVDSEFADLIRPIRDRLPTLERVIDVVDADDFEPIGETEYEGFLKDADPDTAPSPDIDDERSLLAINYTSGTTGKPKGVMFSHRGAYLNTVGEMVEVTLRPDSVFLWTLPMFHCNGWCFTWAVTGVGGTHVCLRRFDPSTVWRLIERESVTHLNGAPIVQTALIHSPDRPQKLSRPLTVTVAGAPPSPTLIERMTELGATVIHVYGLTETYGPFTVCVSQPGWETLPIEERARKMARQGVCFVLTDPIRVVDDEMKDVPADGETMGEVVMRGDSVMLGYYRDPEATATAFRGGWFHSGDLAVLHPDGYVELRDRSKDIIITGGENVSSIEVEQTLYRHPAVLEVAVVAAPHEKWGETPKAYVGLKEGSEATADELIAFCREHLSHFKCPTSIEFCVLPKTSTGKIQKYLLRSRVWQGRDRRIQG